ncbi:MAG: glycoside hydrolase family 3 C-terminal domain-containing protein [Chitinophagales bacterium]|nr:glycoside hydrolase family 3 C-terminal domain-containing protein [Chitinophagales bacterium]
MQAQTISTTEAEARAQQIVAQMSLKEKVNEMHGHGMIRFGLSIIFSKKIKPVRAGGCTRLGVPSTVFLDGPRGVSLHKGATAFPVTMARGASWDAELEMRVGEAMAEEIRALKANYSGAVCMNLLRHPAWGRAQETYGEDPHHVGVMAVALTKGIQKHNVQACAKHFAANSMENNRFGGSMNMDERTLHEVYLPHFKRVIESGVASVMSAYNKLNGEYCGHSKLLLTDILRKDWGFKGYITSDWQNGLYDTRKGIEAGMNIEMPAGNFYSQKKVKQLLKAGTISEKQIDDLILPIISTKLLFTLRKDEQAYPKDLVGCKAHIDLAREVAEKSAVLLKNENNFLPLDKTKVKRIAVIGSLAVLKQTGDHGSSRVFPNYIVSPLEGIANYFTGTAVEVVTAPINDLVAIKAICKNVDAVIIVAGTTYLDEGEYIGNGEIRDKQNPDKRNFITRTGILGVGGDREYLHLHAQDIAVIQAASEVSNKIAVSLVAGSVVTVEEWHNKVPAIIETFYSGMEGGNALARILFGDVNPSGKLPFTVPKLESDLPPFNSWADSAEYGYYHGYTLFDKEKKEPRYPFGFGLSYTSFQISALKTSEVLKTSNVIAFSVKVKNTGQRAGAEVLQLYIGFTESKIDRPEKLLRGFRKVYLQPGEEKEVEFIFLEDDLAYYNVETKTWVIEKGKYEVMVGNSSRDEHMQRLIFEVR